MCSHYVLCVLKKYITHIHRFNKTLDFSVRIKIDNESKPNYIYINYFYFFRIKLSKIFINFDPIRYSFWFEQKNLDIRNSTKQIKYPKKKQITNTHILRNKYLIRSVICMFFTYICYILYFISVLRYFYELNLLY